MLVYPNAIRSKLPRVGTSIFTVMSGLAKKHNALNLSQGFPDFEPNEELLRLVTHYLTHGFNQYAPMQGTMVLREAIAELVEKQYSQQYNPESEITITAGATQAIYTAISAVINEGDEVILFTPAYDCYAPAVMMNGGKPVYVQLKTPDYSIDWKEVKKVINRHTKMIIINTPHNPTGAILTAQDMQNLEKITQGNDIMILSDEVYEHMVFDGYEHQSAARYPKLAERSFIVSSFGKTIHTTGWKIGYCLAPSNLMEEFRKVHQYNVFAVNHPMQLAIADFIKNPDNYLQLSAFYQEKRDFFIQAIKGSRFEVKPSLGTYFQLLNYKNISNQTDTDFAVELTEKHKIASIPVSVFYNNPTNDSVLRFCFAKSNETLEKAAEILCKI